MARDRWRHLIDPDGCLSRVEAASEPDFLQRRGEHAAAPSGYGHRCEQCNSKQACNTALLIIPDNYLQTVSDYPDVLSLL